jgi:hypothetical protein
MVRYLEDFGVGQRFGAGRLVPDGERIMTWAPNSIRRARPRRGDWGVARSSTLRRYLSLCSCEVSV